MKKILIICLSISFSFSNLIANENNDLTKGANVIIENYDVELILKDQEKAILKVNVKKQILNENGDKHAVFFEYYDKFKKIKSFKGKIYNVLNTETGSIKYKDLIDRSLISNYSLYEDNRVKYYQPILKKYPYYIEYSYEIEYNGTFYLPIWQPINSSHLSVKHASLKIVQEKYNPIRYKLIQIEEPKVESKEDMLIYKWEIENIKAREKESLRLPYSLTSPTIYIAPNNFSIDGYSGSMKSWEEFGKWRYELIKTQNNLPEEAITEIKNLVKEKSNKLEIVKLVYEYMQNRTRYVSIQEGIGGWQPIDAEIVHRLGYGDCKALTNYTKALLNAVGIESYYAVVRAGLKESDLIKDFPSNQFNHAILCVPIQTDTIWLECTSQSSPFGYLGDFTGNKHALLVTKSGGKIVKTTEYSKKHNLQNRKVLVDIKEDGSADAIINTKYEGFQYENVSSYVKKSKSEQKEFLLKKLKIDNFEVNYFNFTEDKNIMPIAYDSINLTIKEYANLSSSRMFFDLNILNKNTYVPQKSIERISPIKFSYPYKDIDSIEFSIPENYSIEYVPDSYSIKNIFGEYKIDFIVKGTKIVVCRELSLNKGIFPSESYNDLISFYEVITKNDKAKCVLKLNN